MVVCLRLRAQSPLPAERGEGTEHREAQSQTRDSFGYKWRQTGSFGSEGQREVAHVTPAGEDGMRVLTRPLTPRRA